MKNKIFSSLIAISSLIALSSCSTSSLPAVQQPVSNSIQKNAVGQIDIVESIPDKTPSATKNIISANTPFSLGLGQSAVFEPNGLTVQFSGVKSDSRCASDVTCIWAGEATVHVKISGITPSIEADLVASNNAKDTVQVGGTGGVGYVLKFTDLKPYPSSKHTTTDGEYQATFQLDTQK